MSANTLLPIEASPFVALPLSTMMQVAILAAVVDSAWTAPEIAAVVGWNQRNVRITLDGLAAAGLIQADAAQRNRQWTVTDRGIDTLRKLQSDLTSLLENVRRIHVLRTTRSVKTFRRRIVNS